MMKIVLLRLKFPKILNTSLVQVSLKPVMIDMFGNAPVEKLQWTSICQNSVFRFLQILYH